MVVYHESEEIMTNKFNVGDKVEIINAKYSVFSKGDVGTIGEIDHTNFPYAVVRETDGLRQWFMESQIKLTESKTIKNQRIAALEETVAKQGEEINELKLIVAQIRKPSTVVEEALANDIIEFEGMQYKKVDREAHEGDVVIVAELEINHSAYIKTQKPYLVLPGVMITDEDQCGYKGVFNVYSAEYNRTPETVDVYELIVEDKQEILPPAPKTQNELRAEIIEKAKGFVENILGKHDTFNTTIGKYKDQCVRPVFQVNEKKRAITVLIYGAFSKELVFKGITKCHPKSVFNVWIGKAIALGRALGLDVSEFEQAVQPTHATGQVCKIQNWHGHDGNLTTLKNSNESGFYHTYYGGWLSHGNLKIINDTNAQYSSEVNE